jgi:hypothetical protein
MDVLISLSSKGDGSDAVVMATTRGDPPSPLRAMTGDSIEEFRMVSDGGGRVEKERILMIHYAPAQSRDKGEAPTASHGARQRPRLRTHHLHLPPMG